MSSKALKRALGVILLVILAAIVLLIYFFRSSDPLVSYGSSYYYDQSRGFFVELENESQSNLKLRKVTVNGGQNPQHVELVISYTGRLVTTGVEEYPSDFLPIDGEIIRPRPDEEAWDAIRSSNDEQNIPINYGLYMIHDDKVESVEVTYTYFGLPKTKKIKVDIS